MEGPSALSHGGDIKKAYDLVSQKAFAEAARENGMSEILVLAWLREWKHEEHVQIGRRNHQW